MEKSKITIIGEAKVRYTEMTVYEDLKVRESETCTKSLGIRANARVYKKKPKKCTHCGETNIVRIEVLGAYRGTLFWECDKCERLFCRLPIEETEKYLQKGKGMWTNRNDWIPPSKESLN